MSGWLRYLRLKAILKTGLTPQIATWSGVAAISIGVTFVFLCVSAFIWLARLYDPLTAALVLTGFFLLVSLVAVAVVIVIRRRTVEHARLELSTRAAMPWFDPKLMAVGMEIGRTLGWRRIVPLAAVGILAASVAKEWFGHDDTQANDQPD